jgi:hypothetical protein
VTNHPDRRLLVVESEFARVLSIASRQGSILSELIRQAYDSGKLENRTKHDPQIVMDAHVSVIGHITADELKAKLAEVDVANGFMNRFMLFGVGRSKRLPRGEQVPAHIKNRLIRRIKDAADKAATIGEMSRTPEAQRLWDAVYNALLDDEPTGALGSAIARAEVQVLRMSVVYAATDGTSKIDVPHIEAAYELWRYARWTAAQLFESKPLNANATKLLEALRKAGDAGMSGSEVARVFSGHLGKQRLDAIRAELERLGLAVTSTVETGGRPRMVTCVTEKGMEDEPADVDPLPSLSELRARAGLDGPKTSGVEPVSPPTPIRPLVCVDCGEEATATDVDGTDRCGDHVSWKAG